MSSSESSTTGELSRGLFPFPSIGRLVECLCVGRPIGSSRVKVLAQHSAVWVGRYCRRLLTLNRASNQNFLRMGNNPVLYNLYLAKFLQVHR